MTPLLEGWPTKAKEAGLRLAPLDTNPVITCCFYKSRTVNQNCYLHWKEDKLDMEKACYKMCLPYFHDILWLTMQPKYTKQWTFFTK